MYLDDGSRPPDTSHAVKILTDPARPDDTSSDALRVAVMELFEGLPGRILSAADVEERLVLMGVPRSTLSKRGRLEVYLRHGLRRVKEVSPGRFSLDA
jgi:hypothetical protein